MTRSLRPRAVGIRNPINKEEFSVKKLSKLLCAALAATMLTTAVTGCGNGSEPSSSQPSSAAESGAGGEETPYAEHMEITIGSWDLDYDVDPAKTDPLYQSILDKFNISIKTMNTTWDDYIQKIQTWAAGGSTLPDLFSIDAVGQPFYTTWVKEGIIKEIPDDLSAYPNLKAIMDLADTSAYKDPNGHYYCIPKPNYADNVLWGLEKGVYIRKDWLEACGITADPQSMDELIRDIQTVMDKNPEGAANLTGITAQNKAHFFSLMLNYAPEVACGMNYWVKDAEDQWIPGIFTDRTKTGLLEMNKLYTTGVMDKDIPILKDTEAMDKFCAGKAVALCAAPNLTAAVMENFGKIFPDKDFTECVAYLKPWPAENGKTYRFSTLTHWAETYISGNCDDAKRDRILAFYDYMLGDGLTAMRYGEEGVDYKMDGDTVVITREKDADGNFVNIHDLHPQLVNLKSVFTWDGDFALEDPSGNQTALGMEREYAEWLRANTDIVETNFQLTYMDYENRDKTISDPSDEMIKVVMSDDAESAYASMISTLKANGYDDAVQSFNDAAEAMGIE